MTEVEITPQADDHLEELETEARERILKKFGEAQEWTEHRLEPLSNYPYYELRAGDYRAIITWDRDEDVLIVEATGHRRNVYDRHLPPRPAGPPGATLRGRRDVARRRRPPRTGLWPPAGGLHVPRSCRLRRGRPRWAVGLRRP